MKYLALAPLLFAAGCAAVGPDYAPPIAILTPQFVGGDASPAGALAAKVWWQEYNDAMLSELITRGLQQNLNLQQAQEAIRQAEAQLRQTGVNSALSGAATASTTRAGSDGAITTTTSTAGLDGGLVIDLSGGLRREQEAAKADVQAAAADLQVARLAWLAEIVAAYADARYYQQALALTRETIATRERTLAITRRQFDAGAATRYEVAQVQGALDAARADLPGYLAQFNANVFAIATLVNEPAAPLLSRMEKGAAPLRIPAGGRTGVPADLLRNRPDITYSEALLHAQVATIGVSEAALYPSVSLSGAVSTTEGNGSWSFGPALSLPVLSQGSLRAARAAQISAAKQAELDWRATVLSAVEDVQRAQSNLRQYRLQTAALNKATSSYGEALRLAQQNYEAGAITLLDLLDTDRSTATARLSAMAAQNTAAQSWATLQIATGAGAGLTSVASD